MTPIITPSSVLEFLFFLFVFVLFAYKKSITYLMLKHTIRKLKKHIYTKARNDMWPELPQNTNNVGSFSVWKQLTCFLNKKQTDIDLIWNTKQKVSFKDIHSHRWLNDCFTDIGSQTWPLLKVKNMTIIWNWNKQCLYYFVLVIKSTKIKHQ